MPDLNRQSQSLGPRPALLVVDMSRGFTDPDSPLGCDCDAVIAVNNRLLEVFRGRGLPIFFTTVCYRSDSEAVVFRSRLPDLNILIHGSNWVKIDSRLTRGEGEYLLEKHHPSAFHGTDLLGVLANLGVDSLVVTGLTTSGCVRATVVDGLQNGFQVFVVEDAVGDRNQDAHRANLHDMHAKYADVISSDQLLVELARGGQR